MESKVSVNRLGLREIEFHSRLLFHPSASGEYRDSHRNAEKCLRHGRVGRGNPRRLKQQNRKPAQNRLHNHCAEAPHCQPAHPAPPLHQQRPNRDGSVSNTSVPATIRWLHS